MYFLQFAQLYTRRPGSGKKCEAKQKKKNLCVHRLLKVPYSAPAETILFLFPFKRGLSKWKRPSKFLEEAINKWLKKINPWVLVLHMKSGMKNRQRVAAVQGGGEDDLHPLSEQSPQVVWSQRRPSGGSCYKEKYDMLIIVECTITPPPQNAEVGKRLWTTHVFLMHCSALRFNV